MITSVERSVALGDGNKTILDCWGESGPVLLGVHGITSSRKSWERFAQHYAASYRVYAYDQRGHGDSFDVTGPMTLERSLLDLEAVVAAIGEPVQTLFGHSWGGAVAILGGTRIECRDVVAIDPMIRQAAGTWYAEFVDDLRVMMETPPNDRPPLIRDSYASLPAIEIDAKIHAMKHMRLEPIVALGDDNHVDDGKWDLREDLRAYPKPLKLMLADPAESIVAPDDAAFVRANGGPNVHIEVFAGQGHSLQRTAFDHFAAVASAFMEQR